MPVCLQFLCVLVPGFRFSILSTRWGDFFDQGAVDDKRQVQLPALDKATLSSVITGTIPLQMEASEILPASSGQTLRAERYSPTTG